VGVAYLTKKVKEAKANYLKELAIKNATYNKELATYKADKTAYDKAIKEVLLDAIKSGKVDSNYGTLRISIPNGFPNEPRKPVEPESDTRRFDVKLSMLEGAVDEAITIKVSDEEWAVFL